MHRAALNGLKMVGNKLSAKEEETYHKKKTHKPRSPPVTTVLSTEAVVDDLDRHYQSSTGAQSMEEPENLDLQTEGTAMKTTKKRWEHRALPIGFALHQYPRGLNYPMINKSTTGHRNHSHGSQIICKKCKYWEEQKKWLCKACNYTSPV
jgi:hypothetical protein